MKRFLQTSVIVLLPSSSITCAAGFHYCSGKVIDIVTRASPEKTRLELRI